MPGEIDVRIESAAGCRCGEDTGLNPSGDDLEKTWRARTYALLANLLLKAPDNRRLAELRTREADSTESEEPPLARAWRLLSDAAKTADEESVGEEYTNLFVGVTRGEVVPYGSWYLTGFLMEKPLGALRADLGTLGFRRQPGISEPEDHAGALFEVMAVLIEDERDEQRGFFEKHIESWMARFFKDLQNAESARFYTQVGALGEAHLQNEARYYRLNDLAAGMGRSA